MSPEFRKVALIAAVLGLIVSLFLALRGGDEDGESAGAPTVRLVGAQDAISPWPLSSHVA